MRSSVLMIFAPLGASGCAYQQLKVRLRPGTSFMPSLFGSK